MLYVQAKLSYLDIIQKNFGNNFNEFIEEDIEFIGNSSLLV